MNFTIEPYVGPLPLRFRMTRNEVHEILGTPARSGKTSEGFLSEDWTNISLGYDKHHLLSGVVFSPSATLHFHDVNLFSLADPNEFLRKYDPSPREDVGMLFFLGLGIRTSGYHDGDAPQRAIGVVEKGRWDELLDDSADSVPHKVVHDLCFHSEDTAKKAVNTLREWGFESSCRADANGADWMVTARTIEPGLPSLEQVGQDLQKFLTLAAKYGGEYLGGESDPVE